MTWVARVAWVVHEVVHQGGDGLHDVDLRRRVGPLRLTVGVEGGGFGPDGELPALITLAHLGTVRTHTVGCVSSRYVPGALAEAPGEFRSASASSCRPSIISLL